jgi:CheY-like chemotaxis protein
MSNKPKILAVDDEVFNLDIMTDYLTSDGYEVIGAEDGVIALKKLEANPDIDVIVLDRMMPNLDGIGVLEVLKADSRFKNIPVIMQTAAASSKQILDGINAGVYYYLTKPYEDLMLLGIVRSALNDSKNLKEMKSEVSKQKHVLGLMEKSTFHFRTLEEAKNLAYFIASCFPQPEIAVYGLSELLINAIEHGNLGITYNEKTNLILNNSWQQEIENRLSIEANKNKFAFLYFESTQNAIKVTIKDQGKGFEWEKYLDISPERATDPNGRGIATSKMMSFSNIEYIGNGNEVICTVNIDR